MSRMSRGCLQCRTRKVKCDGGRPSCNRCVQRGDICTGYRDEASLVFRYENEKVEKRVRRRASDSFAAKSESSNHTSPLTISSPRQSPHDDTGHIDAVLLPDLGLPNPQPWIKERVGSADDQVVSAFFERFVMYPCNLGSSKGFLEHLPCMFGEVNIKNRVALRWAVRAAAYASLFKDRKIDVLQTRSMQCYGLALSTLSESLTKNKDPPDDYILMTIVVLDLFEAMFLDHAAPIGAHAEGMKHILRLRGDSQMHGARGWSLFRLSHHRVQKQQLGFMQEPMPESEAWLESLNDELPEVQIEKHSLEITRTCDRARKLLQKMDNIQLPVLEVLNMVRDMRSLDYNTTRWRVGPDWSFKTISRSEVVGNDKAVANFPETIQLHRDAWIAYEWNYHRTARIILHEQLLRCLERIRQGNHGQIRTEIVFLTKISIETIRSLADEILSTVPQSLGDIDHEGHLQSSSKASKSRGLGGYFLLWPIKVIKQTKSVTDEQKQRGQLVFERIRECTGMKSTLGEQSSI